MNASGFSRLIVDDWSLITEFDAKPPMSTAFPNVLVLQYKCEAKSTACYLVIVTANTFTFILLALQFLCIWRGVLYTSSHVPEGRKHSPVGCHGLAQKALMSEDSALGHLQCVSDIIAHEVGRKSILVILLLLFYQSKELLCMGPVIV